jgi:hypothetical protein
MDLRHVDGKFVRRRVLAGMQAGAAVVAQVGQEMDVGLAEFEPSRHGREHRAKTLAVAAGIADLHLARHLVFGRAQHRRAACQCPSIAGQGFKLLA